MRTAPEHILKALRKHDPGLGLTWETRQPGPGWFITHHGQRVCKYVHADGTEALNDLTASELLGIVERMDNFKDGPDRLKRSERVAADRRGRADNHWRRDCEQLHRDAESYSRLLRYGPRPFISGTPKLTPA